MMIYTSDWWYASRTLVGIMTSQVTCARSWLHIREEGDVAQRRARRRRTNIHTNKQTKNTKERELLSMY